MGYSITLTSLLALFGVMFVLALMPTLSSLTVASRSISSGFIHGAVTSLGVVTGDIFYILLAFSSLSVLTQMLGSYFIYIKYIGSAYLVFLGVMLLRSDLSELDANKTSGTSWLSSFLAGLFITLADQKAILFYLGFFPVFVDLSSVTFTDTIVIIIIASVSVGGAKLCYAFMADKTRSILNNKTHKWLNAFAGSLLLAAGILLAVKA